MRITILTIGTRGDVQPFVALGLGLQQAGHTVQLAAPAMFESFIRSYGLNFASLCYDPHKFMAREQGQAHLKSGQNPIAISIEWTKRFRPLIERFLAESWSICQGTEAIICSVWHFGGVHIAEKLGVPCYLADAHPLSPTREFPIFISPQGLRLGGIYNQLTYTLVEEIFWQLIRPAINQWRVHTLGLPTLPRFGGAALSRNRLPILCHYSPSVIPKPADWSDLNHITGYWFIDISSDWQPPVDLVDFLANGPPPVYVGFGSMFSDDPQALASLVVKALALSGQRGILLTGWGGLSNADLPDSIFKIDSIPHDWLFPQVAAIVHHGGAGTTGAGLRSGVPSILVPFFADQPSWGHRVAHLGVGPAPIPLKELSAERLAAAIQSAISDETMKARARALGLQIQAEDGVAKAVEVFHQYLPQVFKPELASI
ncbi:glycosyltransferase [uncultured Nostoc sp.]|uniref:glycosyltransferase n=1 Tax=uncultured Nostoc sp. TaxID=340711 RepID=UPI0035CADAA7